MKIKDIARTATFAWDTSSSADPLIVTGAAAGALDESFSNESQLEIWAPKFYEKDTTTDGEKQQGFRLGGADGAGPLGSVTVPSRFQRLAWSYPDATGPERGVVAAGMETGEVYVFDPVKIINGEGADAARIFKSDKHTGPVRGLDFNPIQKNLFLTGAVSAEIFIHDLNNLGNPIAPGALSTKLNEITSLQWNPTVARIFAASSSSGFTSVWDLKAGKEIVSLQYGGGVAKGMDAAGGGGAGLQMGKRRGMSDVCWHPQQPTRLITSSEDDESPIIMLWDLRNTRAPERILSGHTKGVLSVAWCKQDADLLLSCGKDNRTICWNPQSGEIVGEMPSSADWSFQTSWCPRNPNIVATASFDGHIGIHNLQTTQLPPTPSQTLKETATADDVFGALTETDQNEISTGVSLTQPPKWLRRPASATFGYGGLLASTSNLPGASGKHQSGVVHLRTVVTEQSIIERATALETIAGDKDKLADFCNDKSSAGAEWKALQTLFKANSRDQLVQYLGFSKEDVAKQVSEVIKRLPNHEEVPVISTPTLDGAETPSTDKPEATPSEVSVTKTETTDATEPSLFDDNAPGTPAADFFSTITAGTLRNPQLDAVVPHHQPPVDSSVAATVGSRASSVRDEAIKDNTFHIYPSGEAEDDKLITQALVLGDFASAVNLCLASDRFADALLLAVHGGAELLASTQKAYFARRTVEHPFLRVFQSIVTEDLVDIVQNADLGEWRVIFVVICTFARESDFANLAEQLGQRLQFKWQTLSSTDKVAAKAARQDATLCFLAARKLEKVVSIWIDEMREEEEAAETSKFTAHAAALQSFIEKVAVFQAATDYVDRDVQTASNEAVAKAYPLSGLYDRFYEYADLLATQGLVDAAAKYAKMTPVDYKGAPGFELDKIRQRVLSAAGMPESDASGSSTAFGAKPAQASTIYARTSYSGYPTNTGYAPAPVTQPSSYAPHPVVNPVYAAPPAPATFTQPPSAYAPANPAPSAYTPAAAPSAYTPAAPSPYTPAAPSPYAPNQAYQPAPYNTGNGYPSDPQPHGYGAPQVQAYDTTQLPPGPPPRANGSVSDGPPIIPAAQRRDIPGWNDAPSLVAPKRPASSMRETPKPAAITSPFPFAEMSGGLPTPPAGPGGITSPPPRGAQPPPPPRGGPRPTSAAATRPPPPPQQFAPPPQQQFAPPPQQQPQHQFAPPPSQPTYAPPPQARPPPAAARPPPPQGRGGPPPPGVMAGPPPRALSPLGPGGPAPASIASQIRSPPAANQVPLAGASSPPGPAPGQRMGGPPPPGRASAQPTPAQAPASLPEPVTPATPSKPTHPPGDRSHIPEKSRPIFDIFASEFSRVKQTNLPPHVKKIVDDTERRLNILYDALNNETVPDATVELTKRIASAVGARDANTALALHVELLTSATGETTVWAPGIKQLVRLGL